MYTLRTGSLLGRKGVEVKCNNYMEWGGKLSGKGLEETYVLIKTPWRILIPAEGCCAVPSAFDIGKLQEKSSKDDESSHEMV